MPADARRPARALVLALGVAAAVVAGGCEPSCVRDSDCAQGLTCGPAGACTSSELPAPDAADDATPDDATPDDATPDDAAVDAVEADAPDADAPDADAPDAGPPIDAPVDAPTDAPTDAHVPWRAPSHEPLTPELSCRRPRPRSIT